MRKGGGKAKGSAYEREVCKALSLWVSHNKREDLFWRSAMSGGRATVGRRAGKDLAHHAGDISATHRLGHALTDQFYVECKRYADLKIESGVLRGVGKLAAFWKETCKQATIHKKLPMLIARQDQSSTLLIIPLASIINPYGTPMYAHKTVVLRSWVMRADFFEFDAVMKLPFPDVNSVNEPFLKAGELARILGYEVAKVSTRSRERIRLEPIKRKRIRL